MFNRPGAQGVAVGKKRIAASELERLSKRYGVEFAQLYRVGSGKNGGGGMYYLFSGTINRVWFPSGDGWRWINHTHPGGSITPSDLDKNAIQKFGPQKTSEIIPFDNPPSKFNKNGLRKRNDDRRNQEN